jgi:hypothetical protein
MWNALQNEFRLADGFSVYLSCEDAPSLRRKTIPVS